MTKIEKGTVVMFENPDGTDAMGVVDGVTMQGNYKVRTPASGKVRLMCPDELSPLPDCVKAKPAPQILDSGDRTEYSTGAVRDCKEGKGRCDLMPLDAVAQILGSAPNCDDGPEYDAILHRINWFKEDGQRAHLSHAINYFCHGVKNSTTEEFLLEVAKHFEEGAKKYGPNNWQKGIPVHSYIDSAVRHYLKYRAGWTDESHDRAFVWNLMCCIWTMKHHPELDDFTEKKEAAEGETD